MAILLCIDGTGPMMENAYRIEMRNSFVSRIHRQSRARNKRYLRGPGFDGLDMAWIVSEGYQFIHLIRAALPDDPVLLTGYSRGGAGVIGVAQRLQRDNVRVAGMLLFDAVDRAVGIDTEVIPNNVDEVFHATRTYFSFSRHSFGNCGRQYRQPTNYTPREFRCTHGGMGGVPATGGRPEENISEGFPESTPTFITYAEDSRVSQEVWRAVWPFLARTGF